MGVPVLRDTGRPEWFRSQGILGMRITASYGKTLVLRNNAIPRQGGRLMMMAAGAMDGKLGNLLSTDKGQRGRE
jgi:hypothetical protein